MTRGDGDHVCARCGRAFNCGLLAGAPRCWCADMPPVTPRAGTGCYCPECLRLVVAEQEAQALKGA
jgi:hypothetical protein